MMTQKQKKLPNLYESPTLDERQKTLKAYNTFRNTLEEYANKQAESDFLSFVRMWGPRIVPDFHMGRHIVLLCHKLQEVIDGKCKRLMVFLPPRSTKSVICSRLFPAFYIGRNPSHEILSISHSDELATDFGRTVRDIVNSEDYSKCFRGVKLREDVKAAGKWMSSKNGVYFAAGVRSKIAGRGAHVAILDDALSEEAAMNEAGKAYIKKWWPSGLRTRVMPNGAIIIINTRYAFDDLCGWLLEQEKEYGLENHWDVVSIPAWLDKPAAKLLGLPEGSSYFPEWKPDSVLRQDELEIKATNGSRYWEALYMQKPQPDDGGIVKKKWIHRWPRGDDPPPVDFILQTLDTAFSTKSTADYSVIQTWGIFQTVEVLENGTEALLPNMILLSAEKDRWDFPTLRSMALMQYNEYAPDAVIIEKKASGQSLIQDLRRAHLPIREYIPDRDKVARLYASTPYLENGRIWFPSTEWAEDVIKELMQFPLGQHDDQVDAFTMAVLFLRDSYRMEHTQDIQTEDEDNVYRRKRKGYWLTHNNRIQ